MQGILLLNAMCFGAKCKANYKFRLHIFLLLVQIWIDFSSKKNAKT